MSFIIRLKKVKELKLAINKKLKQATEILNRATLEAALQIEKSVKERFIMGGGSKQAPHPTRPTSRAGSAGLLGSIGTKITESNSKQVIAKVSPAVNGGLLPYAKRIEFGFTGVDSLGRKYNQPPRSYMRAGAEDGKKKAFQKFQDTFKELTKK